ncbi:MAG: helix-turn-helix transcriptional regulator [Mesorhizobium sp.]|nr:helix-turn-helix transcriptional regulator [Mesorhizobium sp.]
MPVRPSGAPARRSRKPGAGAAAGEQPLSLERIVATAVELLDSHGADSLSMRRLADRLGAGAMSLYWHVDNKEQVFDLALDAVLAYAPPTPAGPRDWRADAVLMLEDWRADMGARSDGDVDPLVTVLREGGPFHCKGELPAYLTRLRATGRAQAAAALEQRHPAPLPRRRSLN